MNIFGIDWPDCAVRDCGNPGLVRLEIEGDQGKFWAHLCVFCVVEIRECMAMLAQAASEETPRLTEAGVEETLPAEPTEPLS